MITVTAAEMSLARSWRERFTGAVDRLPFSFIYDGKPSAELFARCRAERRSARLDEQRIAHTLSLLDPQTGLETRCELVEYTDFATVEWTLYLKNTGRQDTPVIEGINALDARLLTDVTADPINLHHHTGSPCRADDYQPHCTVFYPPAQAWRGTGHKRISTNGGRPTNSDLPNFNLEGKDGGMIVVIGWPGQWAAEFRRDAEPGVHVRAGQELTHFVLHPDEEVRQPLMVVQLYQGDHLRAQNLWRRWMLAHNTPRPGGKLPQPQIANCNGGFFPELLDEEVEELALLNGYPKRGIPVDMWLMDAGWYTSAEKTWVTVGTWEVNRKRFPHGLRAISDRAHELGLRTCTWFEPERVYPGTELYDQHTDLLLFTPGQTELPPEKRGSALLDLGNPAARQWITERIDRILVEEALDVYRQDFNIDPLPFWRAHDTPDRQGITEIRYVTGYLAYWDELLRRHPGMLIDSCASGGRRNDLETLRRAVPFLRSDFVLTPYSDQCQTHGLAFWVPYAGTGVGESDPDKVVYFFRSQMCLHVSVGWDTRRDDLPFGVIRRMLEQWRSYAHCYYGDYYPLTSYSLEPDAWMAFQFDRPDLGEGVLHIFRREASPYETARLALHGLEPEATYAIEDIDTGDTLRYTGSELMEKGLYVSIAARPVARVLRYRKGT